MGSQYEAPLLQEMNTKLQEVSGVAVVQVSQWGEVVLQSLGVPYEGKNRYRVCHLPPGKHAALTPDEPDRWRPAWPELLAMDDAIFVQEESSVGLRILLTACGGSYLRALTLHLHEHTGEALRVERPCRLGGCCGCPLEMTLFRGATQLGRIQEDFDSYSGRCADCCCKCTAYHKVLRGAPDAELGAPPLQLRYRVRASLCCCNPRSGVNNCCGATCCKNDMVLDILAASAEPETGKLLATIQKTYAPNPPNCWVACCRCSAYFSNYILEFPEGADATDRALLLAALFQVDYAHFEKRGGDNGGDGGS